MTKLTITEEMIPKEIFNIEEPRLSMPKPQKIRGIEKITYQEFDQYTTDILAQIPGNELGSKKIINIVGVLTYISILVFLILDLFKKPYVPFNYRNYFSTLTKIATEKTLGRSSIK